MFLHLPIRTRGSVPEIPGLDDVLLERPRHLPLVVVVCGWRRRDVAAGQNLASVRENLRTPPLELSVLGGWNATDEGLACRRSGSCVQTFQRTYPPQACSPGSQQACP